MNRSRSHIRQRFIAKHRWGDAHLQPLKQDASFRRYFRLRGPQSTAILMDAPSPMENVDAFVQLTQHLNKIGVRVPTIYARDGEHGLLLLEDLGEHTFTQLLAAGHDPTSLYQQAIGVLSRIHQHAEATHIELPTYYTDLAIAETNLMLDWYIPATLKRPVHASAREQFQHIWECMLSTLPPLPPTLVLRDYHLDNLMLYAGECALLDYQDAVLGSPAYDLVSLLQDARRDIAPALAENLLHSYLQQNRTIKQPALQQHCLVWGAQRHCKVAGIFVRLWLRDGKDTYLQHLPRVMQHLQRTLHEPALQALRLWFAQNLGELDQVSFSAPAEHLTHFCTTT